MTWKAPDVDRPRWPRVGGERELLEALLDWHRNTLLGKCSGLTAEQLRMRSVEPSAMSLLGLIRHMTDVERGWFWDFVGEFTPLYWTDADLSEGRQGPPSDFREVDEADPEAALDAYHKTCERSRALVADASLDDTFTDENGNTFNLRWVYLHMIEEYARHNGHADLLRERIDGATGM